jgi:hypothetical protein
LAIFSGWDAVRVISWLTAGLVAILALFAFILSYSSLQHLAAQHGLPGWLSYLWPLLLDFAMLVFSLAILRANLRQERAIYPWTLTIAFAGLATLANILDVTNLGLPPVLVAASVKALAPIALVLAFELLMTMLRAEVKRAAVSQSLADLSQERETARVKLAQAQAEVQEEVNRLTAQVDSLTTKRADLHTELNTLRQTRRQLAADSLISRSDSVRKPVSEQTAEERLINLDRANAAKQTGTSSDFARAASLRAEGLTWREVAHELGVSESTAKRWTAKGQEMTQPGEMTVSLNGSQVNGEEA